MATSRYGAAGRPAGVSRRWAAALLGSLLAVTVAPALGLELETVTTEQELEAATGAPDTLVLVDFYAPWCGHCKRLEPDLVAAAEALTADPAEGKRVRMLKVDATALPGAVRDRHGVKGYPTVKAYGGPGKPLKYAGPRGAQHIASWLRKLASGAVGVVDVAASAAPRFLERSNGDEATYVAVGTLDDDTEAAYAAFADGLKDTTMWFGHVQTGAREAAEALGVKARPGAIVAQLPGEPIAVLEAPFPDAGNVTAWLHSRRFPLVVKLSAMNFPLLARNPRPLLMIVGYETQTDSFIRHVSPVLEAFRDRFATGFVDADNFKDWLKDMFLIREDAENDVAYPTVFVYYPQTEEYVYDRQWRHRVFVQRDALADLLTEVAEGRAKVMMSNKAGIMTKLKRAISNDKYGFSASLLLLAGVAATWVWTAGTPTARDASRLGPKIHVTRDGKRIPVSEARRKPEVSQRALPVGAAGRKVEAVEEEEKESRKEK